MRVCTAPTRIATLAALLLAAACNDATGNTDDFSGGCPQTREFANTGCAVVSGRVIDSRGLGVPDASVGPVYPSERGAFNSPFVTTTTAGTFRFQITRFAGRAPVGAPDTLSLYVRAVDLRNARPGSSTPPPTDSVYVLATIMPVGAAPVETAVEIRLATP